MKNLRDEMRFCINCRLFDEENGQCTHIKAMVPGSMHPVWGVETEYHSDAFRMRDVNQACGPDALLFEEKVK